MAFLIPKKLIFGTGKRVYYLFEFRFLLLHQLNDWNSRNSILPNAVRMSLRSPDLCLRFFHYIQMSDHRLSDVTHLSMNLKINRCFTLKQLLPLLLGIPLSFSHRMSFCQ